MDAHISSVEMDRGLLTDPDPQRPVLPHRNNSNKVNGLLHCCTDIGHKNTVTTSLIPTGILGIRPHL